jgi:alpha-glucosidase
MDQEELLQYFLGQLTNGECYLIVSKGKARYKMSRGSFKTRDVIFDKHKLTYQHQEGNRYLFGDGKVTAEIIVQEKPHLKFHFHVDYGYNRFTIRFKTFSDEKIYGCGEQYTTLNLKGKTVPIWVSEHQQIMKIVGKLLHEKVHGPDPDRVTPYKNHQTYCSVPNFISSKHYAFYCHEDSYGTFKFHSGEVLISFRQFPTSISLLTANNTRDLSAKLCELVGISPRIPDWVNDGAILAVQGGTEVLRQKYKEAKEKGIKVAALWAQDWCGHVVTSFGYQVYWNWAADEDLYKGLKDFIKELNADGVRFLGYINTFLKEGAPLYLEAKKNDFLVKHKDGSVYHIKSTTFDAGIVDLTNPTAYAWYKDIIKNNMIAYGLSGWMADFGEYLPTDARVYGGDAEKLHNRWPTLWARCCHDAVKESGKLDEIFFFNRAAYGHSLRYTNSMWNGDQHVDYSDEYGLGSVIPASLSLACSGCGIVHSDIGGYTTVMFMKRDAELLKRWSEMNVFTPVFRTHEGNRPKDNAQFLDEDVVEEFAANSRLFQELKPYRLHVLDDYYENHLPSIRPLFFHFAEEEAYVNQREYLFGRDVLVAPVLRPGKKELEVYLPEEEWIQFFTGKTYKGGHHVVEAPLGQPIAFYRKSSAYAKLFASLSIKKGE